MSGPHFCKWLTYTLVFTHQINNRRGKIARNGLVFPQKTLYKMNPNIFYKFLLPEYLITRGMYGSLPFAKPWQTFLER